MGEAYSWLKVVHVLAVISWMAGLFYLPRLFVYHAENIEKNELVKVFAVMERRLLKWVGSWLGPIPLWLWLKIVLVLGMLAFHGLLEAHVGRFRDGREGRSGRYFRIMNEVPTLLLIGIVILVIVKPF
jgi:putative membrane protein